VIGIKLGHALHVSTVVGEISIHVERIGMLLDQDSQIIRRKGNSMLPCGAWRKEKRMRSHS
jgi:hypothetical protein